MESLIYILALALICGTPMIFFIVGIVGGWIGGKLSSLVLGKLDPEKPKEFHTRILKRSALGFGVGFLVGGIPMGIGFAIALLASLSELSYQWALFVTIGIALMGAIGSIIAGSALFSET